VSAQEFVRNDIIEWLQYLQGYGFDGWRFDFVRGWPGVHICAECVPVCACTQAGCPGDHAVITENRGVETRLSVIITALT
jgi:hypothetical protein